MQVNNRSYKDIGKQFFVPEHFEFSEDVAIKAFIHQFPMANLVSSCDGKIQSSCVPLFGLEQSEYSLIGHMSKRNPQADLLQRSDDVVALFNSPSAYVSPRWIKDVSTAPTWSYSAVQVRGQLEVIDNVTDALVILEETLKHLEPQNERMWKMSEIPEERFERLSQGIVAFRICKPTLEGIERLNQDRSDRDRDNIARMLTENPDVGAQYIAQRMLKAER